MHKSGFHMVIHSMIHRMTAFDGHGQVNINTYQDKEKLGLNFMCIKNENENECKGLDTDHAHTQTSSVIGRRNCCRE